MSYFKSNENVHKKEDGSQEDCNDQSSSSQSSQPEDWDAQLDEEQSVERMMFPKAWLSFV